MSGTFSREAAVLRAKRILEMARDGDEAGMAHAISTGEAFSTVDFHGRPPLMIAAKYGNSGCVGLLLASLGEGEARKADGYGATALMFAAHNGHGECVRQLLAVSDANARDGSGKTALMMAAENGHEGCVRLLLPVSDLGVRNDGWDTALDVAEAHSPGCAALIRAHAARMEEETMEAGVLAASGKRGKPTP